MEIAKDLLWRERLGLGDLAERLGSGSTGAFSVAFRRHFEVSPGRFGAG